MNESDPGGQGEVWDNCCRHATSAKPGASMAIEWTLVAHPAVAEVVAVDLPTAHQDAPIRVFVVPNPGYAPGQPLNAELVAYVREAVGPAGPPFELRFVESLPKTRTGKVARWMLDPPERPDS